MVDDIIQWLMRFPEIYNNEPHSSLEYVTPLQVLSGQQEVILNQRKQNLLSARNLRYAFWQKNRAPVCECAVVPASEVVMQLA